MPRRQWLADLTQDVRFGFRSLRQSPVFTSVTLLTLTLAIGANVAIFSLLDVLVLRDLPVREPATLVQFLWTYPTDPPLNMSAAATTSVIGRRIRCSRTSSGRRRSAPKDEPTAAARRHLASSASPRASSTRWACEAPPAERWARRTSGRTHRPSP
jgi:hypothetical protein